MGDQHGSLDAVGLDVATRGSLPLTTHQLAAQSHCLLVMVCSGVHTRLFKVVQVRMPPAQLLHAPVSSRPGSCQHRVITRASLVVLVGLPCNRCSVGPFLVLQSASHKAHLSTMELPRDALAQTSAGGSAPPLPQIRAICWSSVFLPSVAGHSPGRHACMLATPS